MGIHRMEEEYSKDRLCQLEVDSLRVEASKNLRKLREEIGVNQDTFAKVMGVSRAALSYYENNSRTPDIDFINTVALKTECSIPYLLGWTSIAKPKYEKLGAVLDMTEEEIERLQMLSNQYAFREIFESDDLIKILDMISFNAYKSALDPEKKELLLWKCMKIMEDLLRKMIDEEIASLERLPDTKKRLAEERAQREESERQMEEIYNNVKKEIIAERQTIIERIKSEQANNPFSAFRKKMSSKED